MRLFQDFLDRSKRLNQTPVLTPPAYHAPNNNYKIIHQGIMIPNLPAPLHYLNFVSIIGQPNAPMLSNPSAVLTTPLDTATTLCTISPHQVRHFQHYSIVQECHFQDNAFHFSQFECLTGEFPNFKYHRQDSELSVDLEIETTSLISHFTHLRFSIAEHWSVVCQCKGQLEYQGQKYQIAQLGSFEYARSFNFPYLPLAFFTYQIIQLNEEKQLLLAHIRDRFNRVIQSRLYLRDLDHFTQLFLDEAVFFKVHRLYPCVTTPNHRHMYLPREFEWCCETKQGQKIWVNGQSRGDFKFGLAAGYVGSFRYEVRVDNEYYKGESGYIEYVDCRDLAYQEQDKNEKLKNNLANPVPFMIKK